MSSDRFVVAVAAVIVDRGTVLAMRRAADKDVGAGLWETLSGRVRPDEQPLDALAREIEEECGLEVAIAPRPVDAYVMRRGDAPMIVLVYRADRRAGEVRRSAEHDAHAWWTPAEFRARSGLSRLADAIDRALEVGHGDGSGGGGTSPGR
ncbi:MAG TPA: NUDIX domain-containing protein [Sandaracinaceae bacterium LLY-WYZ-13_1]|nr:NUDIX domain-containing protein [Sandaracinaceae bacterium LLY-WYZ-13_1]